MGTHVWLPQRQSRIAKPFPFERARNRRPIGMRAGSRQRVGARSNFVDKPHGRLHQHNLKFPR
jgi:hypothetical protein